MRDVFYQDFFFRWMRFIVRSEGGGWSWLQLIIESLTICILHLAGKLS